MPFRDSEAIARELVAVLKDEVSRHAMRKQAYLLGREMVWSQVAQLFLSSFKRARLSRVTGFSPRLALKTLDEELLKLPDLRLDFI